MSDKRAVPEAKSVDHHRVLDRKILGFKLFSVYLSRISVCTTFIEERKISHSTHFPFTVCCLDFLYIKTKKNKEITGTGILLKLYVWDKMKIIMKRC